MNALTVAVALAPVPIPVPAPAIKPTNDLPHKRLRGMAWQNIRSEIIQIQPRINRSGLEICLLTDCGPGGRYALRIAEARVPKHRDSFEENA